MDGRTEIQNKFRDRILKKLNPYPKFMMGFYYFLKNNKYNSEKTNYLYINNIINFLDFLKIKGYDTQNNDFLKEIDFQLLCEYIEKIKYKKRNQNEMTSSSFQISHIKALKSFFNFLCIEKLVYDDVAKELSYPSTIKGRKKEVTVLPLEKIGEIKKLLESISLATREGQWKEQDKALFYLFLKTGMRLSEVSELNIADIDIENHYINILGKGNRERKVYLTDDVFKSIIDWIKLRNQLLCTEDKTKAAGDALFLSNRYSRMSIFTIKNIINKYTEAVGFKVNPHDLRRTFATNIVKNTGSIFAVKELLGHSNINTTQLYLGDSKELQVDAINKLDY